MDEDSDFTFCQVAKPIDEVDKRLGSDLGDMKINGEWLNDYNDGQGGGILSKDKLYSKPISPRQETIGSLSFKVTDRSGSRKASNFLTPGDGGTSSKISQELKAGGKKPTYRAKVPFEKGFSQMDWMKLTRTHPDLAGLKGQSNKRLISMAEVKEHQTEGSMWTVLKGRVYNIYPYMKFHPGGVDLLMKAVGKDCTSLFNKYHAWVNAEFLLEKCLVGILDESQ